MSSIVMLVEGKTETALKTTLKSYLDRICVARGGPRVGLVMKPMDSDLLSESKLRFRIRNNLETPGVLGVVALIDVKCASGNFKFKDARAAIAFLQQFSDHERYRAHAAQYEIEAWLLPFWDTICKRLKVNRQPPGANPEAVNHDHPPSHHLSELYRKAGHKYDKVRDAPRILDAGNLEAAAGACPQLRALLNSLGELSRLPGKA